ncbi:MAG: STAS domain-containing protein [Planctomycetes bacterium]|nr:STAS domain-containing protein [Planctomycetota bacterium]
MSAIEVQTKDDGALIKLTGRLDTECVAQNWSAVFLQLQRPMPDEITVDASGLENLDGAGIAFLLSIQRSQEDHKVFIFFSLCPSCSSWLKYGYRFMIDFKE